ncbi:MAG TPA: demethoxyubiquinone hydroxylase family protein [Vitreimonas sp.]|uniref:demethoxyubiquinone hydroxylase family protein n=1 Tax=Vitreimonas sp. TaxID=3069702 RepID=UPI002D75F4DA|nr:demethoxyubiquinone hydroxylase family protein [Vitreimonas sp.]HYD88756.1 demethoxyubiquinone hydroxylase family protein [Vitreimonas sp.]
MPPRLIPRILRVNHAGEHGAVAIYSAQLARARRAYPDLIPWLEETLAHEQKHRTRFREAMPARAAKPCRMMFVWSVGGAALGALTALGGRTGICVCTAAVERTVHRHLVEQIAFLERADPALAHIVRDILTEEDAHLAYAEAHHNTRGAFARALSALVSAATETLIFLSTRGDNLQLRRAMART